jgi:hypothetical protein
LLEASKLIVDGASLDLLLSCKQSTNTYACYSTPDESLNVEEPRGFGAEDDCAKPPTQCNAEHSYADHLTITHAKILGLLPLESMTVCSY